MDLTRAERRPPLLKISGFSCCGFGPNLCGLGLRSYSSFQVHQSCVLFFLLLLLLHIKSFPNANPQEAFIVKQQQQQQKQEM